MTAPFRLVAAMALAAIASGMVAALLALLGVPADWSAGFALAGFVTLVLAFVGGLVATLLEAVLS